MKNKLPNKIPTYLGILILIIFLGLLNIITYRLTWGSKALEEQIPQDVHITNLTSSSFVVSWLTQAPAACFVQLEDSKRIYSDVRDIEKKSREEYVTHYINLSDLQKSSTYKFFICCNGKCWGQDNQLNKNPFITKTSNFQSEEPPEARLAYGQVVDDFSNPIEGVLVYLDIPQISPLSAITSSSGLWVISLAYATAEDLQNLAVYEENAVEENIRATKGSLGESRIINLTRNNKPVPPIVLGKDDDFRSYNSSLIEGQLPKEETDIEDQDVSVFSQSGLADNAVSPTENQEFDVLNPEEGEVLQTLRPEIFGVGPKGKKLIIKIESEAIFEAEVVIEDSGNWSWMPPENLEEGQHTLSVVLQDDSEPKTITRTFEVYAAEGGLALNSLINSQSGLTTTPQPGLKPTSTPTPTQISQPTFLPTATPSNLPTNFEPTSTPTVISVSTPTPVLITATASPTETLISASPMPSSIPQTGSGVPLFFLLLGGVVVLLGSLGVLFF